MDLRRELLLTIGALTLLNLVLAFGSIGLLVRMGPAIERILEENVESLAAAEDMLAELAGPSTAPLAAAAQTRVRGYLERAEANVTETEERPVLEALERNLEAAMAGEPRAREQVVTAAKRLIEINRSAMWRVEEEARRLGSAGAWAAVLVGFGSLLWSVFVVVRLQQRFVRPLVELYDVLESARGGDHLRRCRAADAPDEVVQVTHVVNALLDERLRRTRDEPDAAP